MDLIGRTRECGAFDEVLAAARAGEARVLVLAGEAGVGKTSLLQHLVGAAPGFTILRATGVESEMELPFAALHQLCAPMVDRLDSLPGPQRDAARTVFGLTAGCSPDRLLIGLAVLTLLSEASVDAPLLCVVDDAQWLDRETAHALTFVARRLLADRVVMAFATRPPNPDLVGFPALHVAGLYDADARALLNSVLHAPLDVQVRDRIVAETRGNPLALMEWSRGRSPTEMAGGFELPSDTPMSTQIEETYRRRLTELPPETQRLLTVAAADPTGDPTLLWRAASRLGVEPEHASPAVDAGLIGMGPRVIFRHPLVRSAAYASASLEDRQAAHRALAEAIDGEVDPDRRAWHFALGAPGPDEDIAEALDRSAGRAEAKGGLAASAALLERSVALTVDPTRRSYRLLAAAAAHLNAGAFDRAAALLAAAASTPLADLGLAQLDLLRAHHASVGGDPRDAPALFLRAARRFESLDVTLAWSTYSYALAAAAVAGNAARGVTVGDIARAAAVCPRTAEPAVSEQLVIGLAQATIDGPAAAAPTLRRAISVSASGAVPPEEVDGWYGYLCAAASVVWDIANLERFAAMEVRGARAIGGLKILPWALNSVANTCTLRGDLDRAAGAIAESRAISEPITASVFVPWASAVVASWRGDRLSSDVIDDAVARARSANNALALKTAQWAAARLHNANGRYERALADSISAIEQSWEWGSHLNYHELIEAAARSQEAAIAHSTLERLTETIDPNASPWALGICTRSRALLAVGAAAEDLYVEAIDLLGRSGIRPELARAHLLYGEWLRRESRRLDARQQLRTAHELFTSMGIQGFADRTRNELLATGDTVRKRTINAFDELTPQEARIAHLAADGQTNPEIGAVLFISARTVEYHLRKVFTKVKVGSRRELRHVLPRRVEQTSLVD